MRVEQIGDATLYEGDCLEILPTLGPVDAVVTDPPYGINYRSNHNSSRRGKWARWVRHENFPGILGDDAPLDPAPLLALGVPTVIFGGNYCADRLPPTRCWIVWDKRGDLGKNNQADCELAWTNLDAPSRVYTHKWSGLIRDGEENVVNGPKLHPHQKPVAIMRAILSYLPSSVRLIADPYSGSGSTIVACLDLGLACIGIEKDPFYFDIACKRIELAYAQPRLFPDAEPEPVQSEFDMGDA